MPVDVSGHTAGHHSLEETFCGVQIHLKSGTPMGVKDLSGMDLENRHGKLLAVRSLQRKESSADTEESVKDRHELDPVREQHSTNFF